MKGQGEATEDIIQFRIGQYAAKENETKQKCRSCSGRKY